MQAVLSCAVMYWSLVAVLSWDDIDGDFLAWRYAVCRSVVNSLVASSIVIGSFSCVITCVYQHERFFFWVLV